jgi:hypothetical protein
MENDVSMEMESFKVARMDGRLSPRWKCSVGDRERKANLDTLLVLLSWTSEYDVDDVK